MQEELRRTPGFMRKDEKEAEDKRMKEADRLRRC
jgi:hypothetical protein